MTAVPSFQTSGSICVLFSVSTKRTRIGLVKIQRILSSVHFIRFCLPVCRFVRTEILKTAVLSLVLYDCETRFLTRRKQQRQSFREEVAEGTFGTQWVLRKLHIEERHNIYCLIDIGGMIKTRRVGWTVRVRVSRMGNKRSAHTLLVANPK
jgi:hypothetical protein